MEGAQPIPQPDGLLATMFAAVTALAFAMYHKVLHSEVVLASTALSVIMGVMLLPLLRKLGQVINSNELLQQPSYSTPTMGGLALIGAALLAATLTPGLRTQPQPALSVGLATLAFMAIGALDDALIATKKSNKGLSAWGKLLLQVLVSVGFVAWARSFHAARLPVDVVAGLHTIALPGGHTIVLPSWAFWVLSVCVIVSESNGVNIADGLDGMAAGTSAMAFAGMGVAASSSIAPSLSILSLAFCGACLGFLVLNRHPARLFMGDTGSLALGGALGCIGVLTCALWPLAILSTVFVIEAGSSLLQILYKRLTRRPDGSCDSLFLLAPLHHHLQLIGWHETHVTGAAYMVTALALALSVLR